MIVVGVSNEEDPSILLLCSQVIWLGFMVDSGFASDMQNCGMQGEGEKHDTISDCSNISLFPRDIDDKRATTKLEDVSDSGSKMTCTCDKLKLVHAILLKSLLSKCTGENCPRHGCIAC